jgi:hypothetical protein
VRWARIAAVVVSFVVGVVDAEASEKVQGVLPACAGLLGLV